MDFQILILQGGALAVVLFSFLYVLKWLLGHFTAAIKRIENSIHANSLVLLNLSRLQFQASYRLENLPEAERGERMKQLMNENMAEWQAIKNLLTDLAREDKK